MTYKTRITLFIISLLNLLFVATKSCVKGASHSCWDTGYDFLFTTSTIDFGRLIVQLFILALLYGFTYTDIYKNIIKNFFNK
jgi:hypothetical protein